MGPETSMAGPGRAGLRHRARVRRVHAVPRHRATTPRARPSARTAGSTAAWPGTREHGPAGQARLRDRPGRRATRTCGAASARDGRGARLRRASRSAARWARTRRRCTRSSAGRRASWGPRRSKPAPPARASATSTTCCAGSSSGSTRSTARCRRGSAATAWPSCPTPSARWRVDLAKARWRDADEPLLDGLPVPRLRGGYTRAYLHHLLKARETTAQRLLTLHNLAYVARLMAALRAAIDDGPPRRGGRRRAGGGGAVGLPAASAGVGPA